MKPKFGDRLRNTVAGEGNPHRDAFYIRTLFKTGRMNPGTWYEMTDGKGEVWNSNPENLIALPPLDDVPRRMDLDSLWRRHRVPGPEGTAGRLHRDQFDSLVQELGLEHQPDNSDGSVK